MAYKEGDTSADLRCDMNVSSLVDSGNLEAEVDDVPSIDFNVRAIFGVFFILAH